VLARYHLACQRSMREASSARQNACGQESDGGGGRGRERGGVWEEVAEST